ncbi:MAG: DUF1616 domain-containing protein [Candidatus Bathyarchaeia archaeon]
MRWASFTLVALLLAMALSIPMGLSKSSEDVRIRIAEAYEAILKAYESGGNVTGLVDRLNYALRLVAEAEDAGDAALLGRAEALVDSVLEDAQRVGEEGLRARNSMYILYGFALGIFAAFAVFTYLYGPRLFWRLWVRLRSDYRVGLGSGGRVNSMMLSGEVWAVVMAVVLVGAVFAVSQIFASSRVTEPFSELGILGPKMKIGDYPRIVVAGEAFRLYVYVGNHMGKPMYYVVFIKLGNATTPLNPTPAEPFMRLDLILMHGENRTIPIDIAITEPGLNTRLIFELWTYNTTVKELTYHGRWCQIWLNVTIPPG